MTVLARRPPALRSSGVLTPGGRLTRRWRRPVRCSGVFVNCPRGWWCTCCWRGCLFAELGYRQVWHKLTTGLGGLGVAHPTDAGLWQARTRLGVAPLRWLFDLLRGPAAVAGAGVRWCGLLVCAVDGTTMSVPDSPRNLAVYAKQAGNHGGSGYPLRRMVALVACGTRSLATSMPPS